MIFPIETFGSCTYEHGDYFFGDNSCCFDYFIDTKEDLHTNSDFWEPQRVNQWRDHGVHRQLAITSAPSQLG